MKKKRNELETIQPLIEDRLHRLGFEFFDCALVGAGTKRILRVFIDKAEGVTIDDCEEASHAVSLLLDTENFSDKPYTLEVSSPGLDRPLRTVKDFRRVCGEEIRVTFITDNQKTTTRQGRIVACDDTTLHLRISDEEQGIPLAAIKKAKVIPSLS